MTGDIHGGGLMFALGMGATCKGLGYQGGTLARMGSG